MSETPFNTKASKEREVMRHPSKEMELGGKNKFHIARQACPPGLSPHACGLARRGMRSLCVRLLVLVAVGLTFAGVYMFIRVTSFAGYKARRRAPAAP
jgi:hypothetical protein